MHALNQAEDPPVTVDIIQQVKPGCETEFEQVLSELIEAAQGFDGHLGVNIFRLTNHSNPEYRIVFKFDHLSHLSRWEDAPIRRQLLERTKRFTVGSSKWQKLTGLETWFTLSTQGAIVPPPRYKMLTVSFLAIFPLINLLNLVLQPLLNPLPAWLRGLIVTLVMLSLTTYVVMPRMTRLFAGWLYPKSKG
ncbi:hypothetical protein BST81_12880 [Leptolyngbya sp. 'hensonii']|uniref:antibiotic biosynthesis monooxygenase n=1 Tax=Leptolyngbya sp. 'hensonii' TaxID=1922337 RepID=UPI00094FEAE8|nr:antibiotic biosynthesis monooxygenase [Leptolyngbya sp. 'hensonii']OLP17944.1 hypothetical protein BST81_12880 [Leptolyngbya sp. 'hensonii']